MFWGEQEKSSESLRYEELREAEREEMHPTQEGGHTWKREVGLWGTPG